MLLSRALLPVSLAVALLGASATAWAQQPPPQQPRQQAPQKKAPKQHAPRDQQALSESVRRAERDGQVLSAEQVQYDGRDVNRVKIVDNRGRVRVYWDDPAAAGQQGDEDQGSRDGKKKRDGGRTRDNDDGDPNL